MKWLVIGLGGGTFTTGLTGTVIGFWANNVVYGLVAGVVLGMLVLGGFTVKAISIAAAAAPPAPALALPGESSTATTQTDASEVQQLKTKLGEAERKIVGLQEEINSRNADREMYWGLLAGALKDGLKLRESSPSKEDAQEWARQLHKLLEEAEGDWRVKPFKRPTPGYTYADLDATGEQAFMDYQLARLQDLMNLIRSPQIIKFRSGFDPYEWKDWQTPPHTEVKRRCIELANKLTRFLDGWEKYRDQPDKMFPEEPGEWSRYVMEQYRNGKFRGEKLEGEKLGEMLTELLDDLEQHGLLAAEQREHFPVPTDNPQTIREVAARLSAIGHRA